VQFKGKHGKNYEIPRMSYADIRGHMEQKLDHGKKEDIDRT